MCRVMECIAARKAALKPTATRTKVAAGMTEKENASVHVSHCCFFQPEMSPLPLICAATKIVF